MKISWQINNSFFVISISLYKIQIKFKNLSKILKLLNYVK